jgi:hypothetical protein
MVEPGVILVTGGAGYSAVTSSWPCAQPTGRYSCSTICPPDDATRCPPTCACDRLPLAAHQGNRSLDLIH